eukprot:scaffold105589_cov19-Tisochrysis_lutea.AAC.1
MRFALFSDVDAGCTVPECLQLVRSPFYTGSLNATAQCFQTRMRAHDVLSMRGRRRRRRGGTKPHSCPCYV